MARSRSRSTSARFVTSVGTTSASLPARRATSFSSASRRAASTSRWPSAVCCTASVAPMPLLAPVMTTVLGVDITRDYTDGLPPALESSFLLDPEQTARQKRRRERQFHVVQVPALRLLGFGIITLLVSLHETLAPEGDRRLPIVIGAWLLAYGAGSWGAL